MTQLQTVIRTLNKMIKHSNPVNDYQRGFHDALVLVRRDCRNLVECKPMEPWTDSREISC